MPRAWSAQANQPRSGRVGTFALLLAALFSLPVLAGPRIDDRLDRSARAAPQRIVVTLVGALHAADSGEPSLAKRRRFADEVAAVLSTLPASAGAPARRFDFLPAFVIVADSRTLAALAFDPRVAHVDLDEGGTGSGAVLPDAASVLNGVGDLLTLGLDGRGMKVAVIDSGAPNLHPDIASSLVDQQCFCSGGVDGSVGCCPNSLNSQSGPGSAVDDNGHGSNVGGIIVGDGMIAPRGALPEAQLVAVKVLDATNRFCCLSDILMALDWVATHHPDVDAVNLSLGTGSLHTGQCDNASGTSMLIANAIGRLRTLGAVVTVSTGNQASDNGIALPSCIRAATAVGATWDGDLGPRTVLGCTDSTTAARKVTCFSNLGAQLDLMAAGAYVRSSNNLNGVSTYAGTSQAAPMVAACAMAIKQRNRTLTPDQIEQVMKDASDPISTVRDGNTYPFLNCVAALDRVEPLFSIGPGMTGTWYDTAQSGHGLFVEILPGDVMLFSWFTFAPDGNQAWIIGSGNIVGNRAEIDVVRPVGGRFIPGFDPSQVARTPWGSVRIEFNDCQNGRIDFVSPSFGSGSMRLQRLTQVAGTACP